MTIRIIEDGPEIAMTRTAHNRMLAAYQEAFKFYAGAPPDFESWVRQQIGNGGGSTVVAMQPPADGGGA